MTQAQAVLFAYAGDPGRGPAAAYVWEDTTLLGRLLAQLAALGVTGAHVITRAEWVVELESQTLRAPIPVTVHDRPDRGSAMSLVAEIAGDGAGALVIANAEVLTQQEALAGLLADPGIGTGILVTRRRYSRAVAYPVQTRRGLVVVASSPYHRVPETTERFLGVTKVAEEHRPQLVTAAERLATKLDELPDGWRRIEASKERQWRVAAHRVATTSDGEGDEDDDDQREDDEPPELPVGELPPDAEALLARRIAAARVEAPALLLHGIVRASVPVRVALLRQLFWARPLAPEDVARAAERIGDHDEARALLESAVKPNDGFFTTFFVSPYSKYIARWAAHRGLTPNTVTLASMAVGLLAAAGFATGERAGMVAGAILLQLAFTLDCVDGQLARYTRTFSRFGAWLDAILDRAKEYAAFAGLAIGAREDVWLLAGAALSLQIVRHCFDVTWKIARDESIGAVLREPLREREDRLSDRGVAERGTAGGWLRKIALLPIGERFALISLTAAFFDARVTFEALLVWGSLALLFASIGAVRRSLGPRAITTSADGIGAGAGPLAPLRDDGVLARAIGSLATRRLAFPPGLLLLAGLLPMAAAAALAAEEASWGLVAAVAGWAVLCGGLSAGQPLVGRLRWAMPPLVAALELLGLTWVAAVAGAPTGAALFAVLGTIAFRRYDLSYRWQHRRALSAPGLAGGWEVRLLVGVALGAAGWLPGGYWAAAGLTGFLLAAECIAHWRRFGGSRSATANGALAEG